MGIKIDKGVPLPPSHHALSGTSVYPFLQMEVGDSFAMPVPDGHDIDSWQSKLSGAARNFQRTVYGRGKQFATRRNAEGTEVRVWRIADKPSLLDQSLPAPKLPSVKRVYRIADDDEVAA